MAAYKDEERGTWYVSFYYEDWTGAKKRKVKRGFRTKKEALNFEAEYKRTAKADMDMTMGEFVEVYFRDKSQSLKDRSIKNKRDTMNAQLLPYFKDRPMNSITPAEIIQWQNTIIEKGYSDDYLYHKREMLRHRFGLHFPLSFLHFCHITQCRVFPETCRCEWWCPALPATPL